MVGLKDIPCVGVAIDKISEATVAAAIRGLRYMLCYKRFLNDLSSEIGKVEIEEGRVARRIGEAKNDGKIVEDYVEAWQRKVENVKTQADELTTQATSCTCFKAVHFPNPFSRFRLGRKAAHLAITVTEHTDSGKELLANEIAHFAPDDNLPISDSSYQTFGSRQEAYEKLWKALVSNDGYPIIGIYGMPGVGKTRMMENAWKELKDQKIFDRVTRANIGGENLDVIKLQDQLAGYLDCHLDSKDNEVRRASQLKRRLTTEGEKILVILDDVWDLIPLNKIGIPFGDGSSKGCKILLTSRKDTVCQRNNCTDPIQIKALTDGEAWEMFRNTVGSSKINSLDDSSLAKKVCKECGALPLLIQAVGSALKVFTENTWKDALDQLKNCEFQEIDGVDPKVYAGLKVSFEMLAKGEKACLLLCSFFPEDAEIDIKMLLDMARGSQLLGSGRDIHGLVDSLKSASLLLEGEEVGTVKVHDVIRDVARSIAARDTDYAFLSVSCKSRLPDNEKYPTRRLLQLDMEGENVGFPDDLVCLDLHTLWMQTSKGARQQLSSGFFNAFVNLKVVLLQGMFLLDNQLTIHDLQKLRVLILERCEISQPFISSVSRNLEILRIQFCELPGPLDLPELKNLRKLEILNRDEIQIVEKGIISRLTSLEELIVPRGFTRGFWEEDEKSIWWELSQLGCLRNLIISYKKLWWYNIPDSLNEFSIHVGRGGMGYNKWLERKYLRVEDRYIERLPTGLAERAEQLELEKVTGLKYVFSSSECLLHLRKLKVKNCSEIEEIIRVEDTSTEIILLPNLQEMILSELRTLTCFCSNKKKVKFFNIRNLDIVNVNNSSDWLEEIELGSGDNSSSKLRSLKILSSETRQLLPSQWKLQLQNLEFLYLGNCWWAGHNSLFNGSLTFNTLKELEVHNNPEISTLFTTSVFRSLHQLQYLQVKDCSLLKEIVEEDARDDDGTNDHNTPPISLLHLKKVILSNLPNLQNIGISACSLPALYSVEITGCGQIISLFTRSALRNLQNLKFLKVSDSLLKEIVEEEDARDDDATHDQKTPISLVQLQSLTLSNLPNLQNIGIFACYMPALDNVDITGCGQITSLLPRSALRNLQHLQRLKVSDCSLLKEIVEEEEDARDGDATHDQKTPISLVQLQYLTLSNLPNLQNIGIFACYMPALDNVDITGCGQITSLLPRSALRNLQHLQRLKVSDCSLLKEIVEEEENARDDDATHDHKTPISLLQLEYLTLSNLPNLQNIGISACYIPALHSVEITGCGHITSLFTRSALRNLQNLKLLKVKDCSLLKEIVEEEEDAKVDDATHDHKTPISLLHLEDVTLSNLPNLQNIGISTCYMPALLKVKVKRCALITSLFTLSAFTNLQHLQELRVLNCSLLEEIVEDEMNDVTPGMSEKMISLPRLEIIKLANLPRLESFGSSFLIFNFPELRNFYPSNCPEWRS